MRDKALYTAVSNKFFPSLLNLLGSLRARYPNHPHVYVYDLGLYSSFRKELDQLEFVSVLPMPHFCSFWRSCYTWKTYIFTKPHARLNFYMDAGSEALRPLDEIFERIEADGYFCVQQDVELHKIAPPEFASLFPISAEYWNSPTMTAGLFGFKTGDPIEASIREAYQAAIAGLCLGYSAGEPWKNRGPNKTAIIRNCEIFRFDTTVYNMVLRKNIPHLLLHNSHKYGGYKTDHDHPEQLIWNMRMNFSRLRFISVHSLHASPAPRAYYNRFLVNCFLLIRRLRFFFTGTRFPTPRHV